MNNLINIYKKENEGEYDDIMHIMMDKGFAPCDICLKPFPTSDEEHMDQITSYDDSALICKGCWLENEEDEETSMLYHCSGCDHAFAPDDDCFIYDLVAFCPDCTKKAIEKNSIKEVLFNG